ncbi:hypothetical protein ACFXPS_01215 [Nocardia sp. NPDC059091]|uniref:hypothetical protein n=1 Tax=Nocardia sp. NPDC059091 TaxID=3346724 RepID=UPI0036A08902
MAEADSGRDFETFFDPFPYRGDRMWDHLTAYRGRRWSPCLLAQILDGSCGSVESERAYPDPAELVTGARNQFDALDLAGR